MYNEPTDILDLLYLFLLNDKRDDILETIKPPFPDIFDKNDKIYDNIKNILTSLSKTYISYLRGKNPFTFAIKLLGLAAIPWLAPGIRTNIDSTLLSFNPA